MNIQRKIKKFRANETQITRAVTAQTGDPYPVYCPTIIEGIPYDGHAHTFPPTGAVTPSTEPIVFA